MAISNSTKANIAMISIVLRFWDMCSYPKSNDVSENFKQQKTNTVMKSVMTIQDEIEYWQNKLQDNDTPFSTGAINDHINYLKSFLDDLDITVEDALSKAAKYGLTEEVQRSINEGSTPEEALAEWDIY